jgi:hypothetical protein
MRVLAGIALLALFGSALTAQQPQTAAPDRRDGGVSTVTMRDGGVDQVLQSIYIPPLQNAPFTAIVHTQWIRPLPEGGTYTLVNQRRIARDMLGRIYEERWLLVPKNGPYKSQMNVIQVADPVAHTLYNCFTLREPHRCTLETFRDTVNAVYKPAIGASGPLPNNAGYRTHEDLGAQALAGVETVGTRDSVTYNEGVYGNDRPFTVKREFWYAPSLGINLHSEISDPNFGKQVFTLSDVSLSEPDPILFAPPEGFDVLDRRKAASPQPQPE